MPLAESSKSFFRVAVLCVQNVNMVIFDTKYHIVHAKCVCVFKAGASTPATRPWLDLIA